jgi:F-type H+-transporting ATPase subunit alpha
MFLETNLFYSGVRPAINVGISVSRVGGNAQIKAMKKVAGSLRLDLSIYRELESFAKFGSELDPETMKSLSRGERLVAVLNQPQYKPWPVEDQVMVLFAATQGYLDDVDVARVPEFDQALLDFLKAQYAEIGKVIAATKDLPDELSQQLHEAVQAFKADYSGGLAAAEV